MRLRILAVLGLMLTSACGPLPRLKAVPDEGQYRAVVPGMPDNVRFWADGDPAVLSRAGLEAIRREQAYLAEIGHRGPLPEADYLAVSGGGENGAFGAGVLLGWTATGTRPTFKVVTGISTGALTAPFAFLGTGYDAKLRHVYTAITADDVLVSRGLIGAVFQDALADNRPLRRTVARYLDQPMLDAIAAEHRKGRLLLIGTTNLDARQPIVWDIGAIAASGRAGALELVHDILVASAAIPGAFPPSMIDVEIDGKSHQEMHVDGGASTQVFLYPPALEVRAYGIDRKRKLYVIRNARLDPEWAEVERQTLSIVSRAISSLIQTQGVGDLYRLYLTSQRDGVDFNLANIPKSFNRQLKQPFETEYMNELFQLGYDLAVRVYPWAKAPPGFSAPEVEPAVAPRRGDAMPAAVPRTR